MIERFSPDHKLWSRFVKHLERVAMAPWALDEAGDPVPSRVYLGAVEGGEVIAHMTLKIQPIRVPTGSGEGAILEAPDGETLCEAFVQTFAVDEDHRRRGHGRALQQAATATAKALGCYQLRSWASLDKGANYALKIGLGFAIHPALTETKDGQPVGGAFFVKTVRDDAN
jgi:GNAT superfamily N-acetyltransferase